MAAAGVKLMRDFFIGRTKYLTMTGPTMEEEKYEEASGEAANAMIHQLAKLGDITCDDALQFGKLIQDGPLMSAHEQEVMDCIHDKVDLAKDSSGNSQTDYTSNKQKQMFHHLSLIHI